jgi:methylmalonyl-CoA mutase
MNALSDERIYMRSVATRRQHLATSAALSDSIAFLKSVGFDLVIVETAGIGQSDTEIVDLADVPVYVMTSEYGAASQLEKIDMLDFAELVVINKFERRRGRLARRAQAVEAKSQGLSDGRRGRAGLSDHRQPVQ